MNSKLRKEAIRRRNLLSNEEIEAYSKSIVAQLKPYLKGNVALYQKYGNEVDVSYLNLDSYALPIVLNDTNMKFVYCNKDPVLKQGKYNILEPIEGSKISPDDIDVIIVPMVAFDENLNRLGHGKGYYDRYLKNTKALKIGVAFECQKVHDIETNVFDISMDMIVTETCIYK